MIHEVKFRIYHNDKGLPDHVSMIVNEIIPNGMIFNKSSSMISYEEYLAYKEGFEHPVHIDSFGHEMD